MTIKLVGYPTNLGLALPVNRRAPDALRALGLPARLATLGAVEDLGNLAPPAGEHLPPDTTLLQAVLDAARRQADLLRRHYRPGDLWVTLGGDHTTSLGTALGLAQAGYNFDVVWVDAHGDFNTPATSPTGNPHGMVLALLAGLLPDLSRAVEPGRMHILGARDLDPGEQELLARHGVRVYTVAQTLADIDQIIASLGPRVFLSFDTDSMDPAVAPAVRTPVPGGFSLDQARSLVALLGARRYLLAVDVVEYYPDLDADGATGHAAVDVLATACGTQMARLRRRAPA